ncbi:unnamed protein product [Urochloa humidicola]
MSRALAIGRTLAARRPPPAPQNQRHLQGNPASVADRVAKLSEPERAELSKHLDKMEEEFKCKLVQELDAYLQRPTFYNDQGMVNRVLTFCRVPKGERREKLIWRSSLATFFIASWAIGQWETSRCMQYYHEYQKKQGEETANYAT